MSLIKRKLHNVVVEKKAEIKCGKIGRKKSDGNFSIFYSDTKNYSLNLLLIINQKKVNLFWYMTKPFPKLQINNILK